MMFHLLICDDELPVCTYIEQIFMDYAQKNNVQITTEIFLTGENLLQYMKENKYIDMIFLDIELPGNNGTNIGKALRDNLENEAVQIVFISSQEKYAMQLFQVRPFDFMIKPLKKDRLISVFEKYKKIYGKKLKFFEYKVGKTVQKVLVSEIMYFMCERKKSILLLQPKKFHFMEISRKYINL